MAEPRLPRGKVRSPPLDSASARGAARTSVPSGPPRGCWAGSRTSGTLYRHCAATLISEPLWAALHPRPRVSPGGALTTGRVIRGQS